MTVPAPRSDASAVPETRSASRGAPARSGGALLVAAGIMASRLMGLVRERVFAHYLGNGVLAAVFKAALRIPNFLQNLFGEGVLSGSFIPVYAGLLGKGDTKEADRVAGAVFGLLALATSVMVAVGMLATPFFVDTIAPGFEGEARAMAIQLVRILFPGTGVLVLSAWCLGILNSHRKFLLSYAGAGGVEPGHHRHAGGRRAGAGWRRSGWWWWSAYGVVAGSFLQFAVQVPSVLRAARGLPADPVRGQRVRAPGAAQLRHRWWSAAAWCR